MVRAMKPPIFVRSFSEKEREQLEAGLRSKDTFTLRRSQMLCGGCPTECTTARRAARKSCPSELGPQTHEERITDGRLHEPRRAGRRGLLPSSPEGVSPAYIGPSVETSHPQPSALLRGGQQKARRGRRSPPRTEDCALDRCSGQCQPMLGVRWGLP